MQPRWEVKVERTESHGPLLSRFLDGERLPCSLGLSYGSSASNSARLAATIEWLGARSESIAVVEGSYLNRWNLAAFGTGENEAIGRARAGAREASRRIERVLAGVPSGTEGRLLDWEQLSAAPEVRSLVEEIDRHCDSDPLFEAGLGEEVRSFLFRTRGSSNAVPGAAPLLKSYVVEELAVLLELQRRGFEVEVYHGPDLSLLRSIARGCFPRAPFRCPSRTHVSLRLFDRATGE